MEVKTKNNSSYNLINELYPESITCLQKEQKNKIVEINIKTSFNSDDMTLIKQISEKLHKKFNKDCTKESLYNHSRLTEVLDNIIKKDSGNIQYNFKQIINTIEIKIHYINYSLNLTEEENKVLKKIYNTITNLLKSTELYDPYITIQQEIYNSCLFICQRLKENKNPMEKIIINNIIKKINIKYKVFKTEKQNKKIYIVKTSSNGNKEIMEKLKK